MGGNIFHRLSTAALAIVLSVQLCAAQGLPGQSSPGVPIGPGSGGTVTGCSSGLSLSSGNCILGDGVNVAYSAGVLTLGAAGSVVGKLTLDNATSGTVTLAPTTGALGTAVATCAGKYRHDRRTQPGADMDAKPDIPIWWTDCCDLWHSDRFGGNVQY